MSLAQRKAILACILLQVVLVLLLLSGSVGRESRCFASLNHDLQCQPRRPSHEIPNKHPKKWEQVLASVRNQPIQSKYLARRTLEETVRADGRQGCCSNLHGARTHISAARGEKMSPASRVAPRGVHVPEFRARRKPSPADRAAREEGFARVLIRPREARRGEGRRGEGRVWQFGGESSEERIARRSSHPL